MARRRPTTPHPGPRTVRQAARLSGSEIREIPAGCSHLQPAAMPTAAPIAADALTKKLCFIFTCEFGVSGVNGDMRYVELRPAPQAPGALYRGSECGDAVANNADCGPS